MLENSGVLLLAPFYCSSIYLRDFFFGRANIFAALLFAIFNYAEYFVIVFLI